LFIVVKAFLKYSKDNNLKIKKIYIILPVILVAVSVFFYSLQIYTFHRVDDTEFYLLQDISFVPIQVLFVTFILDNLIKKREKEALKNKMNMVIGVFFNEIGNQLLEFFINFSANDNLNRQLLISTSWTDNEFSGRMKELTIHQDDIKLDPENLEELKYFFVQKTPGLLNLLANPNLLEHDSFTNLLWAVFHLADELRHRPEFANLSGPDLNHIKVDLIRADKLIIVEWLSYMKHLKKDYPYLFSIAVRTNPFNPDADITVP
jgi:hypothetical protein